MALGRDQTIDGATQSDAVKVHPRRKYSMAAVALLRPRLQLCLSPRPLLRVYVLRIYVYMCVCLECLAHLQQNASDWQLLGRI